MIDILVVLHHMIQSSQCIVTLRRLCGVTIGKGVQHLLRYWRLSWMPHIVCCF